jgi:hypothetical protein
MPEDILQQLDQHDNQTLGPYGPILAVNAAERFVQLYGLEWAPYADDPKNVQILKGWCFVRGVPVTLRNLKIGFDDLVESNGIRKSESFEIEMAVEEFEDQCPAWSSYRSQKNGNALDEYLKRNSLDVTVDNLKLAFNVLVRKGAILPVNKGFKVEIIKEDGRITIGPTELQLRQEEYDRASALSQSGEPVSKELRDSYHSTLGVHKKSAELNRENLPSNWARARRELLDECQELKLNSAEFNRRVAERSTQLG